MEGQCWYVLRCKPQREIQVCNQLKDRSITNYYPTITVKPVNPRSSKIRPYFPGYVFVQADLDTIGANTLNWLPGTLGLVQFGDYIATLSDQFIAELRHRIDETLVNGSLANIKKGDKVRIVQGPLVGYNALFDTSLSGKQRVVVLLDLLGRTTKIELDMEVIEKLK